MPDLICRFPAKELKPEIVKQNDDSPQAELSITLYKILEKPSLINDDTVIFIRDFEGSLLSCGFWYEDSILEYWPYEIESFTLRSNNRLFVNLADV